MAHRGQTGSKQNKGKSKPANKEPIVEDVLVVPESPHTKAPQEKRPRPTDFDKLSDIQEIPERSSSAMSQISNLSENTNLDLHSKVLQAVNIITDQMNMYYTYTVDSITALGSRFESQEERLRKLSESVTTETNRIYKAIEKLAGALDKDKEESDKDNDENIRKIRDCLIKINDGVTELKSQEEKVNHCQEETKGAIQTIQGNLTNFDTNLQRYREEQVNVSTKIITELKPEFEKIKGFTRTQEAMEVIPSDTEDMQNESKILQEVNKTLLDYTNVKSTLFKNGKKFPVPRVKARITDPEQFLKFQTYRNKITEWYVKGQHFAKRCKAEDHKPKLFSVHTKWTNNITKSEQEETIKHIALTCKSENNKLQLTVAKRIAQRTQELTEILTNNLQTDELLFAKAFRSVVFKYWILRDKKDEREANQEQEHLDISEHY